MSRAKTTNNDKIPPLDATAGCKNPISVEKCKRILWVYEDNQMIERRVTFVPGVYKILDEILVNAALVVKESKGKTLNVTIDAKSNCITIRASGEGFPLAIHRLNGFAYNMRIITEFAISENEENWTEITLMPDLKVFNLEDDHVVALMTKRVVDIAGCLGETVKVEVNGKRFQFKSFSEYCQLYMNSASTSKPLPRFEEHVHERWQICITQSCDEEFQQVSFVNSVATIEGGTHVDYVTNKIVSPLVLLLNNKNNKSNKGIDVMPRDVKNHLWVFVNAVIDNPVFDSQTGERLTLCAAKFGSFWDFSPNFLDTVAKSDIVRNIEEFISHLTLELEDEDVYIPAHLWGKKESDKCTLILTQGDAGMEMAMEARSTAGELHYGVFSLSREFPNVREASNKRIMQNADFTKIKEILGLRTGVKYDDVKSLKYGRVMIMTHQDHDGSYLKGLLINLFHTFWPALLKVPFLQEFKTPIVKAKHSDGKRIESFYTIPEYVAWKESLKTDAKNWTIKYFERMEAFTYDEVDEYFQHIDEHKRDFVWENDEDDEAEELAFSKKKIEARKIWLQNFVRGTFLDPTEKKIKYRDFVNKELVYYFIRDNERSIPSVVDGMTPGQRAILVYLKSESVDRMRVYELSVRVSIWSAYRHGEKSLESTIIGMAQDYVGSNNINLLSPDGHFGTRIKGGKDHDDPWYLFAQLSPMTTLLYPKEDDIFLTYLKEVGQSDEVGLSVVRNWFVPIIPMVLVNGYEGRSTVWSSSVPNYNPLVVIENIKRLLVGGEPTMVAMHPWYKGFNGSIKKITTEDTGASYTFSGNIEDVDKRTFRITELPIRRWTRDYHEFLNSVSSVKNKGLEDPLVQEVCNQSDEEKVLFTVGMSEEKLSAVKKKGLLKKKLKLTTCVGTSNMHLFDSKGVIKKYETPEEILQEFFHARLKIYEDRKAFVLAKLKKDKLQCENKCRFIDCARNGNINLRDRERADLYRELKQKGFDLLSEKENISEVAVAVENSSGYEYLLSLDIETCDLEDMQAEREKLGKKVEDQEKDTVKSRWMRDLDALQAKLTKGGEYQKNREVALVKSPHNAYLDDGPSKKNPQKKNLKTSNKAFVEELMEVSENTRTETEEVGEIKKPRGKAAAQKEAPAAKVNATTDEDDDDNIADPSHKMAAAYNFASSSDCSEAAKPPSLAGTKRRGPDSKRSPENTLRKMRVLSFNKNSGSILARTNSDDEEDASDELNDYESENTDDGDDSDAEEEESDESDNADDSDAEEEESDGNDESDNADDSDAEEEESDGSDE